MLNPVHLRTLTVVIASGSFADAARTLGYTGSAVSQQIAALERATRLRLFEREARSVQPTPAAMMLAGKAAESLAALEDLESVVRTIAGGYRGRVRLGSFATASAKIVPPVVDALAGERPEVEFHLDEQEPAALVPAVADGSLDVALVYRYTNVPQSIPQTLTVVPLLVEDLLLIAPAAELVGETGAGPVTSPGASAELRPWWRSDELARLTGSGLGSAGGSSGSGDSGQSGAGSVGPAGSGSLRAAGAGGSGPAGGSSGSGDSGPAGAGSEGTETLAGLTALHSVPWIGTTEGSLAAECVRRMCASAGFEPRVTVRSNDYRVLSSFVRRGLGVAMLPALGYEPTPGVARLSVALPERRVVSAVFRSARACPSNPVVPVLLETLRAAVAAIVAADPNAGLSLP